MNGRERPLELSFDLYERYALLDRIGPFFRPLNEPYRVLDVGGRTPAFWPGFTSLAGAFIPEARVTVVDVGPAAGLENYVQASGMQLPFRDGTFDLVCSLDTLEHIPAKSRAGFLGELLRVTRDGLYVAFPFDSASNRWAESVVREYADVTLKDPIPALMEHDQFGLPDRDSVSRLLTANGHARIEFGHGNTDIWLLMMLTYQTLRQAGTDFVLELNRRFNQAYAGTDWGAPHYRAAYLLSKGGSTAALEAVRASFGTAGNQVDLAGVLALCQLYLTIAQNGRVTVDKDRHIRNLELDLADARGYRDKWREMAAALETLENGGAPSGPVEESLQDWPAERIAQVVKTASRRSRGDTEPTTARFFDARLRDLEIGLVTNKRAVQAIYDSRIWKTLCSAGAMLERLAGRRPTPDRRWNEAKPSLKPAHASSDDFVGLVCDYPGEYQALPVRDIVEIRGWAMAKSGIERVLIGINDDPPAPASYGIPRPDLARSFSEIGDAGQSGFRFFWDTAGLPEGPYTVRIAAISKNGQRRETACQVRIDRETPPDYGFWISRHEPTAAQLRKLRLDAANFAMRPLISIAVPVYKTPPALLKRCIESVMNQTYPDWQLCLADDGSGDAALTALLGQYARNDRRIRVTSLLDNRGISAATNAALHLATGDYVAFLDHDDELAPFALSEVIEAINESPDVDLFYSDEDKIDEQGRRYEAFFKPGWSPDLFLSCNYVCHFTVMKRSLLERAGGLHEKYSGAQDYEFLLRVSELQPNIRRIPKILYHWRAMAGSTAKSSSEKPAASADGQRALAAYLARTAPGARVEEVGVCRYRVRYPIAGSPRVTILIPSCSHKNVFRAVDDVLEKTTYKRYDILLIDNSRSSSDIQQHVERLRARQAPIQYVDWRGKPFNFAAMNNAAARTATSPYLLFLNDDTSIVTGDWLEAMLEHAQRPQVGAVGAQLWYPNNLIQHAGVVMGLYGNCSHAFKGLPGGLRHYFDFPNVIRNCSAVTGACLLVSREKFFQAGAFDEVNLAVAFQDVDLCLKLLELGYRNVYTPYARLYHYESASKTEKDKIPDAAEDAFMKQKWARYIADDPYYNPNLARSREDFSLQID